MAWINIYESAYRLPEKVCVVAPGPQGRPYYHQIPEDYSVIVVSKAVLIQEIPTPILWAMNHVDQDWFDTANAQFHGDILFGDTAMERVPPEEVKGKKNCYYHPPDCSKTPLDPHNTGPLDSHIRIGTTVSGVAVQMCHLFGAKEVLLCGVDMFGDGYFDGTTNPKSPHGDTWSVVPNLNTIMRKMESEKGIRISTLSPTKLDVPMFS